MANPGDISAWGQVLAPYAAFLIVWLTICTITGWLAGRKNRDSGLWFVLAFFSGPFALLAITLVKPAPRRD